MLIAVKHSHQTPELRHLRGLGSFPGSGGFLSWSQPTALHFTSQDFQNDKAIVLEAVKTNGYALQAASAELRADKSVVLEAVEKSGWALHSAAGPLKNDPDIA